MPKSMKIKDIRMLVTPYPFFVYEDSSTDEISKVMIANPRVRTVYVVDRYLKLVGKVTLHTLIKQEFKDILPLSSIEYFNALDFIGKNIAKDIMSKPVYVTDEDTLKTAFVKMYKNNVYELPVVDRNRRLVGNIDMLELLTMLIEKKSKKMVKTF